jgi:hypothetical protein
MKMMTLSANAQRIGDDIMRLVNAGRRTAVSSSESNVIESLDSASGALALSWVGPQQSSPPCAKE